MTINKSNIEDYLDEVLSFEANNSDLEDLDFKRVSRISTEQLTENAETLWLRTERIHKRAIENLKKYNNTIYIGITRLNEELETLGRVAEALTVKKPYKEEINISKINRFTVNGKFEPDNVRPLLSEFQNLITFNDKVLFRFADIAYDLLNNVNFDEDFLSRFDVDLEIFKPKVWLHGYKPVDVTRDKRFNERASVYKGLTFNSNRAIYYTGISEDFKESFESGRHKWVLTQKTLVGLRFKCLNDRTVRLIQQKGLTHKVSSLMSIKQRINLITGITKRLLARKRDINRHLDNLERLYRSCNDIQAKAKSVKPLDPKKANDQSAARPFPSENKVFIESLAIYRNVVRLVFDYHNVVSIFLRILGSQAHLLDTELKAYNEPMVNPNQQNTENRR